VTRRDAGSVRMVAVDAGDAAVPAPHHLRVTTTRRSRRS
jgi:hypothetical protein